MDCILGQWQAWTDCSASCGGGQHIRSREIDQPPANGGAGCDDTLSEIRECARRDCQGPPPVDCEYGEWEDWAECGRCSGQRSRFKHIAQYPANGGRPCGTLDSEETGQCPRACGEQQYCTWGGWTAWSGCSATCGQGRRHRKRALTLSAEPAEPPAARVEVMSKYEDLYYRTKDLEESHIRELIAAFAAGCVSLIAGMAVVRMFSNRRNGVQQPMYQTLGLSSGAAAGSSPTRQSAYGDLIELNETQMPLVS